MSAVRFAFVSSSACVEQRLERNPRTVLGANASAVALGGSIALPEARRAEQVSEP